MFHKTKKGFTLIELLVVIAIIGILSAVILASLNTARGKGANAAVKSNLHGLRNQAEIVADANGQDYSGVCGNQTVIDAINAAIIAGTDVSGTVANRCNASNSAWAVNVLLKVPDGTNLYWCVDSLGQAKGEADELAGATTCT